MILRVAITLSVIFVPLLVHYGAEFWSVEIGSPFLWKVSPVLASLSLLVVGGLVEVMGVRVIFGGVVEAIAYGVGFMGVLVGIRLANPNKSYRRYRRLREDHGAQDSWSGGWVDER